MPLLSTPTPSRTLPRTAIKMDDIETALQNLSQSSTTALPTSSTTSHDANAAALTKVSWPQIGSVVAESDIPAAWRKTKLQNELQHQYVFLGAVCGIFFIGVLGVLVCSWCSCWWRGDCFWTRRGRPRRSGRVGSDGRLMKWYG
jgi:hypothetical protein